MMPIIIGLFIEGYTEPQTFPGHGYYEKPQPEYYIRLESNLAMFIWEDGHQISDSLSAFDMVRRISKKVWGVVNNPPEWALREL